MYAMIVIHNLGKNNFGQTIYMREDYNFIDWAHRRLRLRLIRLQDQWNAKIDWPHVLTMSFYSDKDCLKVHNHQPFFFSSQVH